MLVRELMTDAAVTVSRETTVEEALRILRDHRITALPVVSVEGKLRGIVSEVDLIRDRVEPDPRAHEVVPLRSQVSPPAYVGDVMTPMVVAVTEDSDVLDAVVLMSDLAVRSLPVLDEAKRVIGIISRSDVVRQLAGGEPARAL